MKSKFGYLLLVIALSLATAAAYFSVWGLSQLFAGASTAVIAMASLLEVGKIVTTTALHKYWKKFSFTLKAYLTIAVLALMFITSVGIYGFLSNAYQKTANKLEMHDGAVGVLNNKGLSFQKGIDNNDKIIATKNKRIDQLVSLRMNQETRLDSAKYSRDKTRARADIKSATDEIQKLTEDIDVLNVNNNALLDSVNKYNVKVLDLETNSEVAGEVGPLKYISSLTGVPMDEVVNYLILFLIFVFDPLAVALILATNRIFDIEKNTPVEVISDDVVLEEINEVVEPTPIVAEPKKVKLEDIKEIKENANKVNTVPTPKPRASNTIQRVGTNKIVKDGNNDTFFFKKK